MKSLSMPDRGGGARRSPRRARPRARTGPGWCRLRRRCRGGRGSRRPGRAITLPSSRRRRTPRSPGLGTRKTGVPPSSADAPARGCSFHRPAVDEHGQDVVRPRRGPGRRSRRSARRPRALRSARRRARRSSFAKSPNQYRARLRCGRLGRRALHSPAHVLRLLPRENRRPRARRRLTTPHGVVDTPAFMPVGTAAAVKAVTRARPGRGGGADHPRQHVSPDAAPGRRARGASWAGCTASRAGAGRS